jgi:prepilin-type processing-associated H-X9-DG protein
MMTAYGRTRIASALALAAIVLAGAAAAAVPDSPQFRGPQRDGACGETGLLKPWPDTGLKLLWKIEGLGKGYAAVSIAGGKILTMGDLKEDDGEKQYVIAYDLATQKRLWTALVGPPHGSGPRCTPTVDGDRVYGIGTMGDLVCVETATGKVAWRKNLMKDFGGRVMSMWRYCESPLVDGDKLVCTPGGKDATIVALNKKTGAAVWKCGIPDIGKRGKDGAGYSSIVVSEAGGVRQYVQMLGRGAVGVAADDGRFLWGYNRIANGTANISNPQARGDHVFVTTAYGTGSALLKLVSGDKKTVKAEEVYFLEAKTFENHHGGVVLVGDHVYGGSGGNRGAPTCLELLTGKIAWKEKAPAKGSAAVLYADGHVLFRYDSGPLYLVEATPKAFTVKGRFEPEKGKGPAWPHPVIHDGKLYLRHHDLLLCYALRGK